MPPYTEGTEACTEHFLILLCLPTPKMFSSDAFAKGSSSVQPHAICYHFHLLKKALGLEFDKCSLCRNLFMYVHGSGFSQYLFKWQCKVILFTCLASF